MALNLTQCSGVARVDLKDCANRSNALITGAGSEVDDPSATLRKEVSSQLGKLRIVDTTQNIHQSLHLSEALHDWMQKVRETSAACKQNLARSLRG